MRATVYIDGGYRPSTRCGACACVIDLEDGTSVEHSRYLGVIRSNNVAEYEGLLLGLRVALDMEISDVQIVSDSMLVVEQVLGAWQVKQELLRPLVSQAQELAKQFDKAEILFVRRHQNKRADRLATKVLDKGSGSKRGY